MSLFLLISKRTSRRCGYFCGHLVHVVARYNQRRGHISRELQGVARKCVSNLYRMQNTWKSELNGVVEDPVLATHSYSYHQPVLQVFGELRKVAVKSHEIIHGIFRCHWLLTHRVNYVRNDFMTSSSCFFLILTVWRLTTHIWVVPHR